jgi:hypothetical protein
MRAVRRIGPWALGLLLAAASGCVSEEEIQADFDAHVEESNACELDADCALIFPGCPLGCFVAVRVDRVEECTAFADELIASYEVFGRTCEYDCPEPGEPYCGADGRCRVGPPP